MEVAADSSAPRRKRRFSRYRIRAAGEAAAIPYRALVQLELDRSERLQPHAPAHILPSRLAHEERSLLSGPSDHDVPRRTPRARDASLQALRAQECELAPVAP